jgi:Ca2+-binding RTX toxin-like protein
MTTTPTVWKVEFTANNGITNDAQFLPVTIGLADNRFLTIWVDNANNVDDDAGTDIIGRIFDAEGNPDGAAFQLNLANFLDGETDPAVAALPDGGFVVAYEDNGTGAGGDAAIRFQRFDAAGAPVTSGTIASGTNGGVVNSNPTIAVFANGDYVVSYQQRSAGDTDVIARIVNGGTNVVGGPIQAGQNSVDVDANPDTIVLSNGNILTAYEENDAAVTGIEAQINTAAGGLVSNVQASGAGTDPHAAALTGGGYALVWQDAANNGNIRAEVRNNINGVVTANFLVQGGDNSQNEPDVVALKDGGFFVVWDDDSAGALQGQRFSSTGTVIGTTVTITSGGAITDPELGLTDDGRILVTFNNQVGEISQVILDPRDDVINGDGTSEVITSRIDGATMNGLGGNDTLLGQGETDRLDGGADADLLKGRGGDDTYFVDNLGDVVDESDAGSNGNDTVQASVSFSLSDGARVKGPVENLSLIGMAAIDGAGNDLGNTIVGNVASNILTGGAGIDVLTGGPGGDGFAFVAALDKQTNVDTIVDFSPAEDTVILDNAIFAKLKKEGVLKGKFFYEGKKAHDGSDRIIHNDNNGALIYDKNGSDKGNAVKFAILPEGLDLSRGDFLVV